MMDFRLLGPVQIRDAQHRLVRLRAQLDRALLALLLLNANSQVSTGWLVQRMWEDRQPPKDGAASYVRDLRKILRERFGEAVTVPPLRGAAMINLDPDCVDYLRVQHQLAVAREQHDLERVVAAARAGLGEWCGQPLQNLDEQLWVAAQREQFEKMRAELWRLLLAAELALGRHERVMGEVAEPLALWPEDEALVGARMLALYRSGRRNEALGVYREFAARIADEHGTNPDTELQNLQVRILNADPALDAPRRVNVPEDTDPTEAGTGVLPPCPVLVGRDRETEMLAGLLAPSTDARPVVVSAAVGGLAGVGKTALAVHTAHQALQAGWFPGGVLFLDLRGYSPMPVLAEQALFALLTQLGAPAERIPVDGQDREAHYRSMLAGRARAGQPCLIIADNASASDQVRPLLPGSGGHRLVVTSRHRLADLDSTRLLDLHVLDPDAAVAMLTEHLLTRRLGDQRITTDPDSTAKITELCGYLPLALRISAALLAADPEQPIAELAGELADTRHRLQALDYDGNLAVKTAFDVSYQKLPPDQARLFRLLALNPGAQTSTEAATALTGQPPHATRRLLKNLHRAYLIEPGQPRGWWRFHDLIALYAHDRAEHDDSPQDRDEATNRLLHHYLTTTRAAADHLDPRVAPTDRSPRFATRAQALSWLDTERPTLVATITHASASHDHYTIALARHLRNFLELRKYPADWITVGQCAVAATRRAIDYDAQANALDKLGWALAYARRFDEAIDCYQQALSILRELGDRRGEGQILNNLGIAYRDVRGFDEAIECYQQALPIHREIGDRLGAVRALTNLGTVYEQLRLFDKAIECYQQALPILREIGDRRGEGQALNNLGVAYRGLRRFDEAVECYQQGLPLFRETGERWGEGQALSNLGVAYRELGRYGDSVDCLEEGLVVAREVDDAQLEAEVLRERGTLCAALGDHDGARRWWRDALTVLEQFSDAGACHDAQQVRILLADLDNDR